MSSVKISVITVVLNSESTIKGTIESVLQQNYDNIEYIIIDGGSTDETLHIINDYAAVISHLVTEPDSGVYDAMNKGLALATGDVVGFLNSDDVFASSDVLNVVASAFENSKVQVCFGDIVFVKHDLNKIVRYYYSGGFTPSRLAYGWMPAHPSLYIRKELFDKYGCFRTDYRIAADYELIVRLFCVQSIIYSYIPKVFVKMRVGGVSRIGLKNSILLNSEIVRACRDNGLETNLLKVLMKLPLKLAELFKRDYIPDYSSNE